MTIRMFMADDDEWILSGLKAIIDWESFGFVIIGQASSGISAFAKIMELKPDVVFTDIIMPGLNGLELIHKLKMNNVNTDVVFLSGYAEFSYAVEACKLGAFDYLLKPIEEEKLMDTVERLIEKHSIIKRSCEELSDMSPMPQYIDNETLKLVVEYVKENYSSFLHLYEIAELYHFNANYISQLFKQKVGISFSEYLIRYRIERAEKLLMETRLPVKDVCTQVGINDYYYFNKLFKKYVGSTPAKWRRNSRV